MPQSVSGNHVVQLFDSAESRASCIADLIVDGLAVGERVLVVCTGATWRAAARTLGARGFDFERAVANAELTVFDAAEALESLLRAGRPDRKRFEESVGALVRRLRPANGAFRVYGEIVDLLAAERDFVGARQLELLWSELLEDCPFALFCGYSAAHFGDPHSASALRSICRCHTDVRTVQDDELGAWLVKTATAASSLTA